MTPANLPHPPHDGDSALAALRDHVAALEDVVSLLGDPRTHPEGLGTAGSRAELALARFRARWEAEAPAGAPEATGKEFGPLLERARTLQAVAAALAEERSGALALQLARVRGSIDRLAAATSREERGRGCDLAG